jgi:hypothetical protein
MIAKNDAALQILRETAVLNCSLLQSFLPVLPASTSKHNSTLSRLVAYLGTVAPSTEHDKSLPVKCYAVKISLPRADLPPHRTPKQLVTMPSMNKKVLLKVLAFGYIAIASFVVLGQNSEFCDRDTACPSRNRWLIACGAISSAIALGMAAASFFLSSDGILGTAEIGVLAFLVLWWAAGAGVAASVRTANSTPVSTGFAFFALFVSFSTVRLSSSLFYVYQLACVMAANSFAPPPSRPPPVLYPPRFLIVRCPQLIYSLFSAAEKISSAAKVDTHPNPATSVMSPPHNQGSVAV